MSDKAGSAQEPEKKRAFIREKVAKPPRTRRQMLGRMFACVVLAIVGGVAAGTSFAVVSPLAKRYLEPTTVEPTIPVMIPTDVETTPEATTTAAPEPTTEATTEETTEETTEPETEPIEDILQTALEQYRYSIDDLNSLGSALRGVVLAADNSIVTVHSVREERDWFDNPLETTGLYAGAIIANTEAEVLILTPATAVEDADSLRVTFSDGAEAECVIRQTDGITGMAVISVDYENLEESTGEWVRALRLGNSYVARQGEIVIAMGAPSGAAHSISYGVISYILRNVQVADGVTRLLYTDAAGDAAAGTFLINTSGEMIGWLTDDYDGNGMRVAMAISDYKAILEKLSNGIAPPYLGVLGQEVSASMQASGMPRGVYVVECRRNGPAYNAGVQSGDIITKIGEKNIETMSDYQIGVGQLREGDPVTVVVQRRGADEYIELEYQAIVGAR